MDLVIGPILVRNGGFGFDCWTREQGLGPGYVYRRIGDADYARKFEVRSHRCLPVHRQLRGVARVGSNRAEPVVYAGPGNRHRASLARMRACPDCGCNGGPRLRKC